jgi:hypothetical protein
MLQYFYLDLVCHEQPFSKYKKPVLFLFEGVDSLLTWVPTPPPPLQLLIKTY